MTVNRTKQRIWEFGPFRLDETERLLLRAGEPVGLTPKVFDTLVALLERSGRLVEKDELMARLWPDTFVDEGALTRNISDLRKALGGERYIETVSKRGYRFVAPVREAGDDGAALIVEKTTEAHIVIEGEEEALTDAVNIRAGRSQAAEPATLSISARHLAISPAKRQKAWHSRWSLKTRLGVTVGFGVLILGAVLGLRGFFKPKAPSEETHGAFRTMRVSQFTASGNILTAAISPDGKYVATALDEGGLQTLCVRQVAANTSIVRLTRPAPVEYWGLTFSNDGAFIYYVSYARNQSGAELYRLPILGGAPRRIPIDIIDTPISFSPAGDRFTYICTYKGESSLKVADVEGGGIQTLVTRRKPGFFAAYPGGAAWAPDGRTIAYAANGLTEGDSQRTRVFVADVGNKAERRLTEQSWLAIGRVTWLGDGSGLVISAREQMDAPRQLWLVSYPGGSARKITNDLLDYDSVSLSADGKSLAAAQTQETFSISVAPHKGSNEVSPELSGASEIFSEVGSVRDRISWTPDDRVVYCSRASGDWDIWIMSKDGSGQRQLTIDPHNDLFPAVSDDGRFIFFASDRAGTFNIWRMEIDGSNPTQITRGVKDIMPEASPDGRWVIYQQGPGFEMDDIDIWRVPAGGGASERLTDSLTQRPAVSPDGRLLAYVYMDEKEWGLAVLALDRREAIKKFPFPSNVGSRAFRWTPDGGSLAYITNEKGASNIWLQPLSGERPRQLTNFKSGKLLSFAWSRDGQWLAYMRQRATSDVVLLRDLK